MSSFAAQTVAGGQPHLAGFEPVNRDAVRGLNDFAAFLDQHQLPEATSRTRFSDLVVIALAWAGFVLIFCYPQLQLLLIAGGAVVLGIAGAIGRFRGRAAPAPLTLASPRIA